jgi:hypothetical protein
LPRVNDNNYHDVSNELSIEIGNNEQSKPEKISNTNYKKVI